jgi:ribosomal protein S18 acetylase RimI-like enzyme
MAGPDTHVRLALPRDVDAVAAIQARAWAEAYADVLPTAVLSRLEPAARAQWGEAVEKPPTDAHHLLVALDGIRVVGFAAVGPGEDEDLDARVDGALAMFAVDPADRGAGHGSRLLSAAAETMRTSRFETAVCWLPEQDNAQREFLESAGWALDGARRVLDMGESTLNEVRLHTALS